MRFFIQTVLTLAASVICPVLSHGQAPAAIPVPGAHLTNGLGARIHFDNENYDAGTNMTGDKIYHTFIITNTGDETLIISAVKPSCGCTTVGGTIPGGTSGGGSSQANTWTHEIAPGAIGIIPIQIATDNMHGALHKTVTVTSNDRTRSNVVLNISGVAWQPIEISPPQVSFAVMPDATNRTTQVVRIYNRTETPLSIWDPSCTTNAFGLELKTNVPGQEFELTVTAPAPSLVRAGLSSSMVQGEISLKTSVSNRNPLTIPAFETVFPEITLFPTVLQIPAGPLAQPATSHLTIRDNIADLRISEPTVNVPGASVTVTMVQTNRQYYLTVVFPQGSEVGTNQHPALTVKTDNPRFPSITIPVTPLPNVQLPVLRGGTAAAARAMIPPPRLAGGLTRVGTNDPTPVVKAGAP